MARGFCSYVGIGYNKNVDIDKPIFKFMKLKHLMQSIKDEEFYLNSIASWDDTWEYPYRYFCTDDLDRNAGAPLRFCLRNSPYYASCFTSEFDTDALWRIYSPSQKGVCIKTTPRKIFCALSKYRKNLCAYFSQVIYMDTNRPNAAEILNPDLTIQYPIEMYAALIKRHAFKHEKELRLIVYNSISGAKGVHSTENNMKIEMPILSLIDEIILDPRLSCEKMKKISAKLNMYNIPIRQSDLYFEPSFGKDYFEKELRKCYKKLDGLGGSQIAFYKGDQ